MKRLYLIWFLAVTLFAVAGGLVQSTIETAHLRDEADGRASTLLSSLDETVQDAYRAGRLGIIAKAIDRLRTIHTPSDRISTIKGLAVCTGNLDRSFPLASGWETLCKSPNALRAVRTLQDQSWNAKLNGHSIKYYARALPEGEPSTSPQVIILVQDISLYRGAWLESMMRSFAIYWLSGLLIAFLIATQVRRWIQKNLRIFRQSLRSLIAGKQPRLFKLTDSSVEDELLPINRDMDELAKKIHILSKDQAKAGKKKNLSWISDLKETMGNRKLLIVANREPYIHQKNEGKIQILRPASGLVTALEPVLRQSGGTWVAHGSGNADRETADANGIVGVPPGAEKYKLKRVWLTPEEEEGYYYGFANEGLWPLCHLAHTRPTFRLTDWKYYSEVNKKFCDAIPENNMDDRSVILVQDYHFALLPQMIKERAKAPKVGLFWHIPWPNPEAFGICPWNKDLLKGMLGSDVVGFHTQYHCNNFLETCNRYLEARIDYERFSVTMENHETLVRAFPIGIDTSPVKALSTEEIEALKISYGIHAEKVAVGVDRLDYTKGLVERVEAIERFLEKNPQWIGKFAFAQMGSASRTHIPAYQNLVNQLHEIIERVNLRFRVEEKPEYRAVVLIPHHSWEDIQYFYQMGDVCLVTSLHDGMNLVAKEYVWCQSPEKGALILSKFAGASRELTEAFIINPYSIEEMADAISESLSLRMDERVARMQAMKAKVSSRNAFHWAADLIKAVIETEENFTNQSSTPVGLNIGKSRPKDVSRSANML
jgi:trehalose-6-phosphate synthase